MVHQTKLVMNTTVKHAPTQAQSGSIKPRLKSVAIKIRKIQFLDIDERGNVKGLRELHVPIKPRSKRMRKRPCPQLEFLKKLSNAKRHEVLDKLKESRDYTFLMSDT